ncbi:MAG: PaaI family thioesterase [Pseudomonadota bacterium]
MGQEPRISIAAFERICREEAPFFQLYGFDVREIGFGRARVGMHADEHHIRPGGTISGPAQMALADFALYGAVLGAIGDVPLAVTTNLSVNFLNRPKVGGLSAESKIIKHGKRLMVGEVWIYSDGEEEDEPLLVAHVTGTYSVPPAKSEG